MLLSIREEHPDGVAVYNFEVEGDHTYFVEDGIGAATAVWVHNECAGWNHFIPKFMGSRAVQGTVYVGEYFHTHYHQSLRKFLSQEKYLKTLAGGTKISMVHRAGYGREQITELFSRRQRIRALAEFHREYRFGGRSFYDEVRSEMKSTLQRGLFD